jgi:hypothetical protein
MSKREMGEHEIFLIVDNVDPKTKFDFLQNCGDACQCCCTEGSESCLLGVDNGHDVTEM